MQIKIKKDTLNTKVEEMNTALDEAVEVHEAVRVELEDGGLTTVLTGSNGGVSVSFEGGENYNVLKLASNGTARSGQRFGVIEAIKEKVQASGRDYSRGLVLTLLDAIINNSVDEANEVL